jgi:hypothetical protein
VHEERTVGDLAEDDALDAAQLLDDLVGVRGGAVTSRPVTEPPEDSTAVVSCETAVPLAGTSSRTVIE